MATLRPFLGLRYDPAVVGDLATVVAPPYDVIDDALHARLSARSPYNAVHLNLNRGAGGHADAARTLAAWRADGVLQRDPRPALSLYAQRFTLPDGTERERVGVIGALRLESFESGRVRPHERTLARALDDRLQLLRAARASLSPIFGLVAAPELRLADFVPMRPPEIDIAADGARHRLWRLDDPATLAALLEPLAAHDVFIADGHHRYETALRYRDETRAALGAAAPPPGAAPYDYLLAYVTTMEDPGLVILATHRVLHVLPIAAAALRHALGRHFEVEEVRWTPANVGALLGRLDTSARDGVAIGVAVAGERSLWLLTAPTGRLSYPTAVPAALRALSVTALHQIVLGGVLGLPIGDRGGAPGLSYTQDAARALGTLESGDAAAVFLLPPTTVEELRAVSLAGLTMPEKSTYFHPKLLDGLVVYPLGDGPEPDVRV